MTDALELIKQFEGCRLETYLDSRKIPTIGWGHTGPEVHKGLVISQAKADEMLQQDARLNEVVMNKALNHYLVPHQYAALLSLMYNIGKTAFLSSTVLKLVNKRDYAAAGQAILAWCHETDPETGKKRVNKGLLRRRQLESKLFLTGSM